VNALYNEIDPFAADWLDSLIAAAHIAPGRVERRSITELTPADVAGPGQRHFFAGIGGWSYALRLAGIPDDADVWTGSCPCQPFSSAGARAGFDDPRHLWPAWFALIRECRPATIFGEQVAGPDGLAWLDVVCADLERCGYAVGAAVLSAAGVGAPHIRQRIYFVAHADAGDIRQSVHVLSRRPQREVSDAERSGAAGDLADAVLAGRPERWSLSRDGSTSWSSCAGELEHASRARDRRDTRADDRSQTPSNGTRPLVGCVGDEPLAPGTIRIVEYAAVQRPQGAAGPLIQGRGDRSADAGEIDWSNCDWIPCRDPERGVVYRSVEPGTFPLAHGVPNRVGRLRGYGNAIVPQVAAVFIKAAWEAMT
jgi:DNA (cytosine-5)-methyltransferase 1